RAVEHDGQDRIIGEAPIGSALDIDVLPRMGDLLAISRDAIWLLDEALLIAAGTELLVGDIAVPVAFPHQNPIGQEIQGCFPGLKGWNRNVGDQVLGAINRGRDGYTSNKAAGAGVRLVLVHGPDLAGLNLAPEALAVRQPWPVRHEIAESACRFV